MAAWERSVGGEAAWERNEGEVVELVKNEGEEAELRVKNEEAELRVKSVEEAASEEEAVWKSGVTGVPARMADEATREWFRWRCVQQREGCQ